MTIRINEMIFDEHDLITAWRRGNDAGNGFGPGNEDHTPQEAVESSSTMTHRGDLSPEGCVVASDHGKVIVVRNSNGPWAVDVTDMFDACGNLIEQKI